LGWRQVASIVAAGAAALGAVPVVGASLGGRWHVPRTDTLDLVSWMPEHKVEGAFRVLWLGDPEALPLDGWRLAEGTAYATSRNGPPTVVDRWPGADPGTSGLLADALDVARRGDTTRLGHLLGPMAVRYIVVPTPRADPPAPDLLPALAAQLDLKRIDSDRAIVVYENAAWAPARALLDDAGSAAIEADATHDTVRAELAGSRPVLIDEDGPTSFKGTVPRAGDVLLSESSSRRWRLQVAGQAAERSRAFGWANAFLTDDSGSATLRYRTSPVRWLAILIEALLWFACIRFLVLRRRG
jgi:hypothetical protein